MHLSWSRLNMRLRCAEQERRRYVEGEKIPPQTPLVVGGAFHKGPQVDLGHKLETGSLLELGAVQETVVEAVNATWEDGVTLSEDEKERGEAKVRGEVVDMAVALATCHHEQIAPTIEPTHVERRMEVELSGYDLTLLSFIDLMEKPGFIETKSSARAWTQEQADTFGQVTAYSLMIKVIDGFIPTARIDVLKKLKRGPEIQQLHTSRSNDDFVPFLELVAASVRSLEHGDFFPNGWGTWVCSPKWCGYWTSCAYTNSKRRPKS